MRNPVHNTLIFFSRFSKKTGLADQLKFVRVIQNISIYPNRKICKCDLAPENAETPRWWWLLMARRKKTRLQQFSGHSRLHLFLTDQEFPFPAVAPSRIVWHFLKSEINFTFWEISMIAQVFPGTLSIYRWSRHLNKALVKGGMTDVQLTWAGPCESKNCLRWVNFVHHPTWGLHISSPIEWKSALTVQHLRIEVRVVYWKYNTWLKRG